MLDRPIQAAAEGLPMPTRSDLAKQKAASIRSLVERLSTIDDINALYGSLQTLHAVAGAMSNQPKHFDHARGEYTPAGQIVELICDYLGIEMDLLVAKMKTTKPLSDWDRHIRHGMVLKHETLCGAETADIAALASHLAASEPRRSHQ